MVHLFLHGFSLSVLFLQHKLSACMYACIIRLSHHKLESNHAGCTHVAILPNKVHRFLNSNKVFTAFCVQCSEDPFCIMCSVITLW